jgi:flagellar basal body-associated protein FliL
MTGDNLDNNPAKTIGWIVILIVVVAAIGFGVVGFVLFAIVTEQPHHLQTQHPSSPEYNLQKSERDTPIYINYNVDAAEEAIIDVCSEYKDSLVYIYARRN